MTEAGTTEPGATGQGPAGQGLAEQELTEQQRKWMASVRATLERSTGRPLAAWVEIARGCPETMPRARQRWLKETHGLGQNYAMLVLGELARAAGIEPRDPVAFAESLWSAPGEAAILAALVAAVASLPDVVTGQRKGFTSWSRRYAFAAARPVRSGGVRAGGVRAGGVRLGLAVAADAAPSLAAPRNEGWSERLTAVLPLASPAAVDAGVAALLRAAWERS